MSKPPVRPYYTDKGASTAFYDLVTEADTSIVGDIDVYAGLAPPGGTVLELGAGTGRIALALAQRGFRVTGLDIAPAMLAQARTKRARLGTEVADRVKFVKADMTAFDLGRTFDAVICTFYTLSHLPPGPRWARTFGAIRRHLAPGGVAAVHLPLKAQMEAAPPPPTKPVLLQRAPDGQSLGLYVDSRTFSDEGRMDLILRYVVNGPRSVRETFERLTYYHGDPDPFASEAGLRADGDPVDMGSAGVIHLYRHA
ncbi:class I SAM-dependent methyltransferase [Brevundimonas sp. R86498]|uniref:class I SAM-dependent methyltransferase n=1 Tax=Brevundimonas sp. R86498 TaxID=3093845 RepID=UPI0037CA2DA0